MYIVKVKDTLWRGCILWFNYMTLSKSQNYSYDERIHCLSKRSGRVEWKKYRDFFKMAKTLLCHTILYIHDTVHLLKPTELQGKSEFYKYRFYKVIYEVRWIPGWNVECNKAVYLCWKRLKQCHWRELGRKLLT